MKYFMKVIIYVIKKKLFSSIFLIFGNYDFLVFLKFFKNILILMNAPS